MRVLDTKTGQFTEIDPEDHNTVYAILSHTWDGKGEQTYEELRNIQRRYNSPSQAPQAGFLGSESTSCSHKHNQDRLVHTPLPSHLPSESPPSTTSLPTALAGRLTQSEVEDLVRAFFQAYSLPTPTPASVSQSIWDDPELSPKIRDACRVARENGYPYIWIDSCCIDKASSSELSEAINSMYKWYGRAEVCYAYLADVPPGGNHHAEDSAFRKSRWFGRGWTLQELIAPFWVEFLSGDWASMGSKHDLVDLVESITGIDHKALLFFEPLDAFSVAQRLSWAAKRETTREEDRAYSLLGLFNIHMPTLYGEGAHAFRRLQEHIIQRIPDQSLFAWGDIYVPRSQLHPESTLTDLTVETWSTSPSARSPDAFLDCRNIRHVHPPASHCQEMAYTLTAYGLRAQFNMVPLTKDLLLQAVQHSDHVQPRFSETPKGSQWYLIILQWEHSESEYPGHLLGRVCYTTLSKSGVEVLHHGFIRGISSHECDHQYQHIWTNILPLSPRIIEHYRPHIALKTVYIPHTDRTDRTSLPAPSNLRRQPYTSITLLLLMKTRDALRSRGYLADLRGPEPACPTTQWLTLSNHDHNIIIAFRHTLEQGGKCFTINAKVTVSGSHDGIRLESAMGWDDSADRHTMSWSDFNGMPAWETKLPLKSVRLDAAEAGTLTVNLELGFAGNGKYIVDVDVLSEELPVLSAFHTTRNANKDDAESVLRGIHAEEAGSGEGGWGETGEGMSKVLQYLRQLGEQR